MNNSCFKKEINLLPPALQSKIAVKRERTRFKVLLLGSSLSLLLLFYVPVMLLDSFEKRLEDSKAAYEEARKNEELLLYLQNEELYYRELQESLPVILERTVSPVEILKVLGQILPAGVEVQGFHLRGKQQLDLTFQVHDPLQVAQLSVLLGGLQGFEVEDLSSVPLAEGKETVSYILFIE